MNPITQHLVVIIDTRTHGIIEPKKYACSFESMTKEEAINSAKKSYENKYQNFNYNSYYFKHEIVL